MTILLIGCGKQKLDTDVYTRAQDLYTGPLFKARRTYAEDSGLRWLILSAKHRVIWPTQQLLPYDLHLSNLSKEERLNWASRVFWRLRSRMGLSLSHIEVHAGATYVEALQAVAPKATSIVWPVQGMQIGQQLRWYKSQREADPVQMGLFGAGGVR